MILILTPSSNAKEFAATVQKLCSAEVEIALSTRDAVARMLKQEYTCVAVDAGYIDTVPFGADTVVKHCGAAVSVFADFALNRPERVARMILAGLRRAQLERVRIGKIAREEMNRQYREAVGGILLAAELAMRTRELPEAATLKMRTIRELAREMKKQLELEDEPVRVMPAGMEIAPRRAAAVQ